MAFWLPLLAGLGSLFGGIASQKSAAKSQQADIASQQNSAAAQRAASELAAYTALQNAKARQAEDIATRPGQRTGQGALGDLITQYRTPAVEWEGAGSIPRVSGGFQGLAFSPSTQASAQLMQRDALLRQLQGQRAPDITQVGQVPDVSQYYPSTDNYPSSGTSWLDTLLGLGGLVGGVAGAWNNTAALPEDPWKQTGIPRRR